MLLPNHHPIHILHILRKPPLLPCQSTYHSHSSAFSASSHPPQTSNPPTHSTASTSFHLPHLDAHTYSPANINKELQVVKRSQKLEPQTIPTKLITNPTKTAPQSSNPQTQTSPSSTYNYSPLPFSVKKRYNLINALQEHRSVSPHRVCRVGFSHCLRISAPTFAVSVWHDNHPLCRTQAFAYFVFDRF